MFVQAVPVLNPAVPTTSILWAGFVTPMPTSPEDSIVSFGENVSLDASSSALPRPISKAWSVFSCAAICQLYLPAPVSKVISGEASSINIFPFT